MSLAQHREFDCLDTFRQHLLGIIDTMTCSLSLQGGSEKAQMFLFQQDRTDFEKMTAEIIRMCNAMAHDYPKYCQALVLRELL